MKWKTLRVPKAGERRTRRTFALFPHVCDDGFTRWLCPVGVKERFGFDYQWGTGYWISEGYCEAPVETTYQQEGDF